MKQGYVRNQESPETDQTPWRDQPCRATLPILQKPVMLS
jgi:hypothetical protein